MKKWFVLLVLAALLVLTCGCTDEASPEQASTTVPTATVKPTTVMHTTIATPTAVPVTTLTVSETTISIKNNAFNPSKLTIKAGSQVRWVNDDDHVHNIEFIDKTFSSSTFLLGSTQSFSQQFDRQGEYAYMCRVYPSMKGTITVVP